MFLDIRCFRTELFAQGPARLNLHFEKGPGEQEAALTCANELNHNGIAIKLFQHHSAQTRYFCFMLVEVGNVEL